MGPKAAPAADRLIDLLKAADPEARPGLALAVGQVTRGTDKGVPALLALLKADVPDRDGHLVVAEAFRSVGNRRPDLVKALADDAYARPAVILRPGCVPGRGRPPPPLAKLLADRDPAVRFAAAAALADVDPKADGIVPVLVEAARAAGSFYAGPSTWRPSSSAGRRPCPTCRSWSGSSTTPSAGPGRRLLAALGDSAAGRAGDRMLAARDGAFAADAEDRAKAAPAVPALLKQLDREGSIGWAAGALGAMGETGRPAVAVLLKKLEDPDRRLSALRALGLVAALDRAAVQAGLTKYAADPDPECRAAAVAGLAASKADAAVPTLTTVLGDADADVRVAAAGALGTTGPAAAPAVPALAAVVRGKDARLRVAAAAALGGIGPAAKAAVPDLVAALDDKKAAWGAAQCSGRSARRPPRRSSKLIALLDDDGAAYAATVALGEIGPAARDALPNLRKLQEKMPPDGDDGDVPPAAAAIARIEGKAK